MASSLKMNLSQEFSPFKVSYARHLLINLCILMEKKVFPFFYVSDNEKLYLCVSIHTHMYI